MTEQSSLLPEQIAELQLKAFRTNLPEDRQAYFDAASKYFQDRHYRAMERERANLAPTVKPLEWEKTRYDLWEAKSSTGEYCVGFDDYWWAELNDGMGWEWVPDVDPRSFDGPYAAMQAAQTEHERRILSDLTTAPVTPQQQARFVIDYLERETGVDFGDFIGMADKERIKAIAGEPTNDQ